MVRTDWKPDTTVYAQRDRLLFPRGVNLISKLVRQLLNFIYYVLRVVIMDKHYVMLYGLWHLSDMSLHIAFPYHRSS